jgi:hypothetical protein
LIFQSAAVRIFLRPQQIHRFLDWTYVHHTVRNSVVTWGGMEMIGTRDHNANKTLAVYIKVLLTRDARRFLLFPVTRLPSGVTLTGPPFSFRCVCFVQTFGTEGVRTCEVCARNVTGLDIVSSGDSNSANMTLPKLCHSCQYISAHNSPYCASAGIDIDHKKTF